MREHRGKFDPSTVDTHSQRETCHICHSIAFPSEEIADVCAALGKGLIRTS